MASVKAKVNTRRVQNKVFASRTATRKFKNTISQNIEPVILDANRKLLRDFLTHAISVEIAGGPTASNISGSLGGEGNLYSFIGFDAGTNPLAPIVEILVNSIQVRTIRKANNKFYFEVRLTTPSKEDIFEATPMPWADGRSWAEGIEKGISGLGNYLFSRKGFTNSRSGHGVQTENLDGKSLDQFRNQTYISALLREISVYLAKEIRRNM